MTPVPLSCGAIVREVAEVGTEPPRPVLARLASPGMIGE